MSGSYSERHPAQTRSRTLECWLPRCASSSSPLVTPNRAPRQPILLSQRSQYFFFLTAGRRCACPGARGQVVKREHLFLLSLCGHGWAAIQASACRTKCHRLRQNALRETGAHASLVRWGGSGGRGFSSMGGFFLEARLLRCFSPFLLRMVTLLISPSTALSLGSLTSRPSSRRSGFLG